MAFGDRKGILTANAVSITNPFAATGSVAVVTGDLVVAVISEQTDLTAGATPTDNLGNIYTAQNAGNDAGTLSGRSYWSRVTFPGTLTSVSVSATGSNNNVVFTAVVYTGPFPASPLDASPANTTNDTTSPFTCPPTGTLAQTAELVVAWMSTTTSAAYSATSPNLLDSDQASSTVAHVVIGSQVVSATTSIAPAFTAGSSPAASVLGTMSFKQDTSAPFQPDVETPWDIPRLPTQPQPQVVQRSVALTSFVASSAPFAQTEWPKPTIAQHPISARTWLESPPVPLLIDTVNMPCMATDWMAPVGPLYSVSLRGFIGPKTAESTFVQPPLNNYDWPNPRAAEYPAALRTWLQQGVMTGLPVGQQQWAQSVRASFDTRQGLTIPGLALQIAAAAGKPFQQSDWPLPVIAPHPLSARTWIQPPVSSQPSDTVNMPCMVADWAAPIGPLYSVDLRTWIGPKTKEAVVQPPLNNYDWPKPRTAEYPVTLRTFIADATELLNQVEYVSRGPLFTRIPRATQPPPFIAPNTLLTTLGQPAEVPPRQNYDWPKPRLAPFPPPFITQDLLLTTLAVPPDTTNMPCVAVDWLPATRWQLQAQAAQGSPLSLLTATPAVKPFAQQDWPNPIQTRAVRADVLGSPPELTLFNVKPFAQTQWDIPKVAVGLPAEVRSAYLALLQSAGQPKPFAQTEWPLPRVAEHPTSARTWTQDAIRTGFPVRQQEWPLPKTAEHPLSARTWTQQAITTGLPVRQQEWPLPKRAVGLPAEVRSSYLALLQSVAQPKPFFQADWPLPQIAQYPISARTWDTELWLPRTLSIVYSASVIVGAYSGTVSIGYFGGDASVNAFGGDVTVHEV